MTARRGLVLDANILLRAVFGKRVRYLLETFEDDARFYTPDICFHDAQRYISVIAHQRRFDIHLANAVLDHIGRIVERVDRSLYEEYESSARGRIEPRDPKTGPWWPLPSCSICPFGPKIRTFSEAASPPGQQTELSYTSGRIKHLIMPSMRSSHLYAHTLRLL